MKSIYNVSIARIQYTVYSIPYTVYGITVKCFMIDPGGNKLGWDKISLDWLSIALNEWAMTGGD